MGILNVDNLRGVGSGTSVTCLSNRLETTNINASGIITATEYRGGSGNTGIIIDSSGNVGVRTSTPGVEFEVWGGGTVANFKGTGGNCFIGLTDVDAGAGIGYIGSDNGALLFQTPGSGYSTKLNIASDGKISAGTIQTTHTLGITGGSSSQLLVKGTEADIWMESTGPSGVWRILGSTGTNTHRFRIYDNTNGKEPFYIDGSSGSNTQHVHVNSGNLVFDAAGTGIDFGAQTSSSASGVSGKDEILNHYEEGSWTPTLTNGFTYQTLTARYTRIGNVVHLYLNLYRNDSSSKTSDLEITNLPFAMGSYTNSMGLGFAASYNGSSDRRIGFINTNNASSVKVIKDGTTSYVSYDNFVVNSRALTMKWWYYTA